MHYFESLLLFLRNQLADDPYEDEQTELNHSKTMVEQGAPIWDGINKLRVNVKFQIITSFEFVVLESLVF